jgi:two-component system, chemotaxis family, chemotaxis protein CheV
MNSTNILLESGTNELEIVEFFLREQDEEGSLYTGFFGVNVAKVLEIIRKPRFTTMPNAPHPAVLGAFTQRNRVIPLVDLSVWLGKQPMAAEDAKVIVTEFNQISTAFLVSGVTRIHRISWEDVKPPDNSVADFSMQSIIGVVQLEGRIVFLLDLERIVLELDPGLGMSLDQEVLDKDNDNRKYRALVVDDSSMVRSMLKGLLEKAGFDVETQNDGRKAWDRLTACKEQSLKEGAPLDRSIQIVVSDIEMPSMDGLSLTRKIKEDGVLRQLPVILFSSLISERLRHKGAAVGADGQISKPEVSELANMAKRLIRERQ